MKYSYCLLTILLTLTSSLKHHSGFHLSTTLTHLTASGFTQSLADKLSSDPQVRDLVMKLNQTELSQTVLTKMLDLIKSNSTLLKQLTDQVWQNTPESLKSLTDGEKEGLVNMALSHPEGFGKEVEGPKVLEWVKGQDALKGLAEKLVPKVSHLSGSGDVQQKIAEAILKDPTISRLIKQGKANSPEFQSSVLKKTFEVVKTDPSVQADFAKKVFSKDRFGRTLTQDEQNRLLAFMIQRPQVLGSTGQPSLKDKQSVMQAAKNDLKDIYSKWQTYKTQNPQKQ